VKLGEGRKREVRRLFAAIGRRVLRLVRTRIGDLGLDGLRAGEWRRLEPTEVDALAGRPLPVPRRRPGPLTVAIDGTSGSGKSTIGRALARRLGARFVDTGLLYRALTLAALDRGIDPDDGPALAALAGETRIEVTGDSVRLDGVDVSAALREPRVDRAVSSVSRHAEVRSAMLPVQRAAVRHGPSVMVGRDIGTVVLPRATLKLFLTASAAVRAERRAAQFGREDRIERYQAEIAERDAADMGRAVAPLRRATDALVLDTGELDVDACVAAALDRLGRR
jgi:cytidylate kinase